MAQVVEQEKPPARSWRTTPTNTSASLAQGPSQPRWLTAGARKRDGAVRAPRLSHDEARAMALHERRADCRADVCARWRWRRQASTRQQTAPLSAPVAHAVCVNGRFAPKLSSVDKLPKGVQVLSLEAALTSNPELVEPYLGKLSLTQHQRLHRLEHGVPARRRGGDPRSRRDRWSGRSKWCSPRCQRDAAACRIPGC